MTAQSEQQDDPVVAAIERVLMTEREGLETLQRRREDAARILSEARENAAAIAQRAERCITRLHRAYLQKLREGIERHAAAAAMNAKKIDSAPERTALAAAARRVAAKLTGEEV